MMVEKKAKIIILCSTFISFAISVWFLIQWQTVMHIVNTCVVFVLNIVSLCCFILESKITRNIKNNESIDEKTKSNIKVISTIRYVAVGLIMLSMTIAMLPLLSL